MTKTEQISFQILTLIKDGMEPMAAIKQVLGTENVDKMISDIYDALRAK